MAKWTSPVLGALSAALATGLVVSLIAGGPAGGASPQGNPPPPQEEQLRAQQELEPLAAITPNPELLYVPVTPCRIVDTRSAGGRVGNGTTRSYYVTGTTMFVPQGGKSGGCGIPTGAKAVTATLTAVTPTNAGYMRAWAAGGPEPAATLLNYATSSTGTGATVPIRSGGTTALTVKNYGGPTHLVIDVTGYYAPQLNAYISTNGEIIDQSGRLVSAVNNSAGTYTLTWDRDISTCSGHASGDISGYIMSVYTSGNTSYVYVDDNAGNAANYWFNVLISC